MPPKNTFFPSLYWHILAILLELKKAMIILMSWHHIICTNYLNST